MSERTAINKWASFEERSGVPIFWISLDDDAGFFENPAEVAAEVVAKYEADLKERRSASCALVVESEAAPSPLIRVIYRLFKACQKRSGTMYVCKFPQEYMTSLSTLALPEQHGFSLSPTLDQALENIAKEAK